MKKHVGRCRKFWPYLALWGDVAMTPFIEQCPFYLSQEALFQFSKALIHSIVSPYTPFHIINFVCESFPLLLFMGNTFAKKVLYSFWSPRQLFGD